MRRKELEYATLGSLLETVSPRGKQLKTDAYAATGRLPIVDQGQLLIAGYTDEDVEPIIDVPVVVFGDHTRIVKYIDFPFIVGADGTKLIKPNTPDIDRTYFYYLVHHAASMMDNLGYSRHFKELKEIDVGFHTSLAEQRKIAAILRTWDDAIEKYDNVVNIKIRLKNALSIKLLSKRQNKHAPIKLLGDLCAITTGRKDVNEGNPQGAYPFYTCAKETTFSDTYSFDTEAILISGNGVGVGYTHYYKGKFEAYQRTYVLSRFVDNANIQYVLYYLRQYLRQQILKEKQDSAMPYIKLGLLKEFEIPLPEIGHQLKIVSALMAVDEEIDGLRKQQSIIKSQKRGLMQKLLTGEWRVNVSGDAEAA